MKNIHIINNKIFSNIATATTVLCAIALAKNVIDNFIYNNTKFFDTNTKDVSYRDLIKSFPKLLKQKPQILCLIIPFISLVGITTTNFFCKTNGIKASTFLASLDSHSRTALCVYATLMLGSYKPIDSDDIKLDMIILSSCIGFLTSNVIAKPLIATALYGPLSLILGMIIYAEKDDIVSDVKNAPFATSACFLAGFAIADIYR